MSFQENLKYYREKADLSKAKLGGKGDIQAEIYQAAALLIRLSERIEKGE